ncbi:MAG: hypothetical protein ACI8R4_003434 [Paracoccaceae bacterium]|jgi:hypothetical protein
MDKVSAIEIDIAKNVFHLHGASGDGAIVFRKALSRSRVCSAPSKLDRFYLEFSAATFLAGIRSGNDESIQVHGRSEGDYC